MQAAVRACGPECGAGTGAGRGQRAARCLLEERLRLRDLALPPRRQPGHVSGQADGAAGLPQGGPRRAQRHDVVARREHLARDLGAQPGRVEWVDMAGGGDQLQRAACAAPLQARLHRAVEKRIALECLPGGISLFQWRLVGVQRRFADRCRHVPAVRQVGQAMADRLRVRQVVPATQPLPQRLLVRLRIGREIAVGQQVAEQGAVAQAPGSPAGLLDLPGLLQREHLADARGVGGGKRPDYAHFTAPAILSRGRADPRHREGGLDRRARRLDRRARRLDE